MTGYRLGGSIAGPPVTLGLPVSNKDFSCELREDHDEVTEIALMMLEPGIWLEFGTAGSRCGNALCYDGGINATLHTRQSLDEMDEDFIVFLALMYGMMEKAAEMKTCLLYDRAEDGKLVSKTYTSEGHRLEQVDAANGKLDVVPAEKVAELLALVE